MADSVVAIGAALAVALGFYGQLVLPAIKGTLDLLEHLESRRDDRLARHAARALRDHPFMSAAGHERYDADERRLVASAPEDLWTDQFVDQLVDAAMPILDGANWRGVPDDAPPRWAERSTAILALAAIALRATRVTALTVRAGYGAEARPDLRRLREAAGHARGVAADQSGQYAENWLQGKGKAGKPRVAFGVESEGLWKLFSGPAHADFRDYANASAHFDEDNRLIHRIGPQRDLLWDNVTLWLTARTLTSVLAGVIEVHPHIDEKPFLEAATPLIASEPRLEQEIAAARPRSGPGVR